MSNPRLSRQRTTKLAGLSAAVLLAVAGGCGGGDTAAVRQIRKAEQTVGALTAEGTFASLADAYRRKQLSELHDSMTSLASSGPEAVQAAALSVAARAKAGIASLDAKAAVEADQRLDEHLAGLRAGLNTFTLQKSIAEANTGAGTMELIGILQANLETNKKSAEEARREASGIQAVADELTTRNRAVAAQASAKRQEASSIASGMQGATATQGLEILKRSTAVLAEADALEQQASELATRLGLTQSQLARARTRAAALDQQGTQILTDITGAQSRLGEERKLAETAGAAAEAAALALRKSFGDFAAFRSGTLEPAHQTAVASAQKVVELSRQATAKAGGNPQSVAAGNTGKLSTVSANQNHADALVSQARAYDQIAGTLTLLASAQPPLPGSSEFAAAADSARKTADDTLTQAREIYSAIRESIDGISDEKLKGRLAETSRIIEGLSSKQGVKAPEPVSGGNAPAATGADADAAAVKKTLDRIHDKIRAGDMATVIRDMTAYDSDEQRDAAASIVELQSVIAAFDKACRDKLNVSAVEALGQMGAMVGGMGALEEAEAAVKNMTSADYTVTVNGDKATASSSNGDRQLVKRDGTWMLAGGALGAEMPALPAPMVAMVKSTIGSITDDINSGKITTPEQVQTALLAKGGGMNRPGRGGRTPGGEADPNK
ncbi:MAG: hypothetical protein Q8L55_09530 [Phycisphaerales bacterium]|nr:hypothetical protein [Phycisphaerales bacterium]